MPRRPVAATPSARLLEDGLRDLVKEPGPSAQRLLRGQTPGMHALTSGAGVPESWPPEIRAEAVLRLIYDLVPGITNERWKKSAMAAFRFPPEHYSGPRFDSLNGRLHELARREAPSDDDIDVIAERCRGYWISAANQLASRLEQRLEELSVSEDGWSAYRPEEHQPPPLLLPISFDQTHVLYQFDGRRGVRSTSYRWLTAHGAVDKYEAVGWYYSDPDAPVEVNALANCVVDGPMRDLPQGGRSAVLRFSRTLQAGESYFFAYSVDFNSKRPCRPSILYTPRGRTIKVLTIRAQFDASEIPVKCWYVDVAAQTDGASVPDDDAPEILKIAPNGFVEHEFRYCMPGRQYGVLWQWGDPLPSSNSRRGSHG